MCKTVILADKPTTHSFMMSLCRKMTFRNISVSDEATVNLLVVVDGAQLTSLSMDDVTLSGEGR